jgi:hypothetical protein
MLREQSLRKQAEVSTLFFDSHAQGLFLTLSTHKSDLSKSKYNFSYLTRCLGYHRVGCFDALRVLDAPLAEVILATFVPNKNMTADNRLKEEAKHRVGC